MTQKRFTPYPSVHFDKQVSQADTLAPLMGTVSGEVSANKPGLPLGVARSAGKVTAVVFSVLTAGKRDTDCPSGEVDVMINGTSVLTTKPSIRHLSGEASQQKTTHPAAADAGVTAAVIDHDNNTFSAGDVFTWNFAYSGNTSPNTKMNAPVVYVELVPTE
jgi:hypothetical protein